MMKSRMVKKRENFGGYVWESVLVVRVMCLGPDENG
jgi:hypothetical protein